MQNSLESVFGALADAARLDVVRLLRKKPRRSSEIAEALELSRPLTSRHLGVLRKAGLVEETSSEEDARVRVYRLRPDMFSDVRRWLDEVEAFWNDQLGAFQAHVERKYGAASSSPTRAPAASRSTMPSPGHHAATRAKGRASSAPIVNRTAKSRERAAPKKGARPARGRG